MVRALRALLRSTTMRGTLCSVMHTMCERVRRSRTSPSSTEIRKASRARAPDSPMSGEGMDTRTARPTKNTRQYEVHAIVVTEWMAAERAAEVRK
jgi:hypothetical protein